MADYSSLTGITTSSAAQASSTTSSSSSNGALGQADFFKLLTQQLSYQDPFKPTDNSQMISQMASFTTADGINQLNTQMTTLNDNMTSSQALMASSLVGQKVLSPTSNGYLTEGDTVKGVITTGDGASNLKISITDADGNVVREIPVNGSQTGNYMFEWDGLDKNGNQAPTGTYTFKANGLVGNERQDLGVLTYGQVESVTLGNSQVATVVKVQGIGSLPLSQILEISN